MADVPTDSAAAPAVTAAEQPNSNLRRRANAAVTAAAPTTSASTNPPVAPAQDAARVQQPTANPTSTSRNSNNNSNNNNNFRAQAVAGAMSLGLLTAAVGGTYLLSDNDTVLPIALAACVATVSSLIIRLAFPTIGGNTQHARTRVRHFRTHRHFTGERAAYVRTSQRLALMDRDFTDADYELLLDLDNNSQRFRQFLEGASDETVTRLPTFIYQDPEKVRQQKEKELQLASDQVSKKDEPTSETDQQTPLPVDQITSPDIDKESKLQTLVAQDSELADDTARHCIICLEDFEHGMKIRILPCFHRFMAECIDPWLKQQARCPVCKNSIRQDMHTLPPGCT
ncbi:hypothetical protein FGB62_22g345 [Gracilaria domingensis]|nr:hypothetical protein FGB62_22g345 [Gracilaria domingensis]